MTRLWFVSWQREGLFLSTIMSRLALVSTQLPIKWVMEALSLGVNWPRHETDHYPPSSASWYGTLLNTGTTSHLPLQV